MADLNQDALRALKTSIQTDAPQLAALLDGPNAAVAVASLGKTLLGDAEATLAEVVTAAQSADKLKVAGAEQDAQLRLRQSDGVSLADLTALYQAETQRQQAAFQDVENARVMQQATRDHTNQYLAYAVTAIFFTLIVLLIFSSRLATIDDDVKNLLFTLLGVVATGWANIVGFYFGSSSGSAAKSETITRALLSQLPPQSANGNQPAANA
jgi:hypothetical protein